jgi:anti-sigma factor RsiW
MNESNYRDLVEASWRRRLTAAEEAQLHAYLAIHPEKLAEWEDEAVVNDTLRELKQAPLSSNFTSQVMLAVEREAASVAQVSSTSWVRFSAVLRRYFPRFAAAALVAGCSYFSVMEYQAYNRKQVARGMVATIGEVASVLPSPEVLQDFDTIHHLRDTDSASDQDLLAVLEK